MMRSRPSVRLLPCLIGLLGAASGAACSDPPTAPTPVLIEETFTGTVATGGVDAKVFEVAYQANYSDASITVTSLNTVAGSTPSPTTIGEGFGTIAADGGCARDPSYSATAAAVGQELRAAAVFLDGPYCVQVFDAGSISEPVTYGLLVRHY